MYSYEKLSNNIKIAVSSDHTFGTDAVLLSYFANIKRKDIYIDFGTGCGIIPFIIAVKPAPEKIYCVDIQQNAVEQVKHSIEINSLQNRVFVKQADIREIDKYFETESFTAVTMNPPYKPVNTGIESLSESARIARHEVCCNMEDMVKAASYLLKFGGRLCICQRPERLTDAITLFRQYKLEPKRLRFVVDKDGEKPFLFLLEGKKGSKPFLQVEKNLVIKKENGKFTEEMLEVYGDYAKGYDR